MKNQDPVYEEILNEFCARLRKQITTDRVQNLEFVSADKRESFAFGFDSALSLLKEIATEKGLEKTELGLGDAPVSSLVRSKL